jgi:hypothetical protein
MRADPTPAQGVPVNLASKASNLNAGHIHGQIAANRAESPLGQERAAEMMKKPLPSPCTGRMARFRAWHWRNAALQHILAVGGDYRSNAMSYPSFARIIARVIPKLDSRDVAERAYLNDSASLYDLECREREIERGKFAPHAFGAVNAPVWSHI